MQPVVLPRSEHNISRTRMDSAGLKVLYRLHRAGFVAYLVGGAVRDLLLERKPKDYDVGTSAHPGEIKKLFGNCRLIGRRFRLAHVIFGRDKVIEVSTFRRPAENTDPEGDLLVRNDNTFGTPEEDAERRDITINGLFYDIATFSVIDFVGGLRDLDDRIVRTIGDPNIRLREDPIRMLRVVKFAARLDFAISEGDLAAIRSHRADLLRTSPERLRLEIGRLLGGGRSEIAFRLLEETGLLEVIAPEVTRDRQQLKHLWRDLRGLDELVAERGGSISGEDLPQIAVIATLLRAATLEPRPSPPRRSAVIERRGLAFADSIHLAPRVAPATRRRVAGARGRSVPEAGSALTEDDVRVRLDPVIERLSIPRRDSERLVDILLTQERLANPGERPALRRSLARRPEFPNSLIVFEAHVRGAGQGHAALDLWNSPSLTAAAADGAAEHERGRRKRTRRRRGDSASPPTDVVEPRPAAAEREPARRRGPRRRPVREDGS